MIKAVEALTRPSWLQEDGVELSGGHGDSELGLVDLDHGQDYTLAMYWATVGCCKTVLMTGRRWRGVWG